LAAANDIIRENFDRKGKELWSEKGDGAKINYFKAPTDSMEAYYVASEIQKGIDRGRDYSEFAVFYRVNAQSRSIEQALRERKIPYRVFGGISFFQRKEVKDVLAYLKLILNTNDNIQLKRVINEPKRGIGLTTLRRIEEYSIDTGSSMYEIAAEAETYPNLERAAERLRKFVEMIEDLRKLADEKSVAELYDAVIEVTDIKKQYELEKTINARSRIENIEELKSAIMVQADEYFETYGINLTLEAFLESVTLATDADKEVEGAYVSIMTLHSAKGLEFPVVFMTGMEEGIFPSMQTIQEGRLEEERRLCYVGVTRAMEEVYIINTMQRTLYGRTQPYPESQFLRSINPKLMNYVHGSRPARARTKSYGRESFGGLWITKGGKPISIAGFSAEQGEAADVNVGQRVRHKKFGDGTVTNTEGSGTDKMIEVTFDMAGRKRLMAAYAKLKIIE
jgi:DNA helicase-2/ATP-dependent DNA helicase PcrA